MEELNDKDFDRIFKARITEEFLEFEEESWSKMEKKLHKRDRLVFYRNASIILLLLSFGIGFYYTNKKITIKEGDIAGKKIEAKNQPASTDPVAVSASAKDVSSGVKPSAQTDATKIPIQHNVPKQIAQKENDNQLQLPIKQSFNQQVPKGEPKIVEAQQLNAAVIKENTPIAQPQKAIAQQVIAQVDVEKVGASEKTKPTEKVNKVRRKMPISLAIAVGPDFNSTTTLIGGKTNLAFGLSVGVGLTKKISIQTGLNYGHKNYNANANNYTFNNPNTKNTIAEINAACKVIEIPLRASINVSENQKKRIEVNAGLSSYLMLKEKYVYKYTVQSGKADRLLDATNKNQHILSVLDLSATYNIKLNKKLAFGIEPYVKIPLTGIGEGSVPLKSSGISLKLRYDFNKN